MASFDIWNAWKMFHSYQKYEEMSIYEKLYGSAIYLLWTVEIFHCTQHNFSHFHLDLQCYRSIMGLNFPEWPRRHHNFRQPSVGWSSLVLVIPSKWTHQPVCTFRPPSGSWGSPAIKSGKLWQQMVSTPLPPSWSWDTLSAKRFKGCRTHFVCIYGPSVKLVSFRLCVCVWAERTAKVSRFVGWPVRAILNTWGAFWLGRSIMLLLLLALPWETLCT